MASSAERLACDPTVPDGELPEGFVLPDCAAVAIIEGGLQACRRQGYVAQRMTAPTEIDFWVRWDASRPR